MAFFKSTRLSKTCGRDMGSNSPLSIVTVTGDIALSNFGFSPLIWIWDLGWIEGAPDQKANFIGLGL